MVRDEDPGASGDVSFAWRADTRPPQETTSQETTPQETTPQETMCLYKQRSHGADTQLPAGEDVPL
ncbi:MAG: hypothetical protein IKR73_06940 [Oscillospiraceae bacterium]|nr:hypothetical protein [Oscillospiraceae bacterium]